MKRHIITIWMLLLFGALCWPEDAKAQVMADYSATPPFISNTVPPNILLLLDNSGSMNRLAYANAFDPAETYSGIFVATECYQYASSRFQPDPAADPATPGTCTNATYPWSGNLLNYVSMRRMDITKMVMVGGVCAVSRDADVKCSRVKAQDSFSSGACCQTQTASVARTDLNNRMPSAQLPAIGGSGYFHLVGSSSSLKGTLCVDDDAFSPSSSAGNCSDGDGYNETNWTLVVDRPDLTSGVIQQVGNKARFGIMEFNTSAGGHILSNMGSSVASTVAGVENTVPATWTPLSEALYEATRYFAQISPAFVSSDYTTNVLANDPYYFTSPTWASTAAYVTCCKSFVILFTDGQPTQDTGVLSTMRDLAHTAASHGTSDHCASANGCTGTLGSHSNSTAWHNANNDHHDNCSLYYGGTTGDSCGANGSHYLDDVAYYAHTTDLRQPTLPLLGTGKDLTGVQSLNIYSFFAFGTGGTLLQDAAKVGSFVDLNANNIPDLPQEYDVVNNTTGVAGADGIPDNYYEAEDASKLQDRLMATITSILQKSSSGTSISVLATSSTGDGSLYQAYFFPTLFEGLNEVKWTGYTQGLFLDAFGNIREDTNADGRLVFSQDFIMKTRFDTVTGDVLVDRFKDLDGDGKADSATPFETVTLREVKSIWEAGKQLALKAPSARNILTWVDTNNDGVVDAAERIPFTTTNSALLGPYLRAGAAPYTADNIINWVRGTQVAQLRDRQLTVGGTLQVWKLGDPINATPTIVGPPKERYDVIYGDSTYTTFFQQYKGRRQVAYVGANDGMLHAFNAGYYHRGDDPATSTVTERGFFTRTPTDNSGGPVLGDELWGFIPYQALPHLQWLTRPDYTHVYYVDLKPKVTDVRIFTPDADHPDGWGTILIAGMRLGGSCGACTAGTGAPPMTVSISGTPRTFYSAYFVLDITNPEKDPVLLWSFSSSDLGLTTSYPAVLRVNPTGQGKTDNTQAKWYIVAGTGTTGYAGGSTQTGKVYVLEMPKPYIAGSSLTVTSFPTADSKSFMGDIITVDVDLNYRVNAAYVGNAIDNSPSTPTWKGKMYRLATAGGIPTLTSWGVGGGSPRQPTVLLSEFTCSPSPSCTGATKAGPILAAPTLTIDDSSKLWVFFGTGRYYGNPDKTSTETQYFIGVKDPVATGGCSETSVTSCERKDLVNVSTATICIVCTGGTNQVSNVTGVTTFEGTGTTSLIGLVQSKDGWFTTLPDAGERNLSSPTLLGGTVFFTTFIPTSDICKISGDGFIYALFYQTGSAYKESVIGTETSGGNTNVKRRVGLGTGLPSQMAVQIGGQGSGASGSASGSGCQGRITGFIQASTGALNQFCGKPALSSWSRYISWLSQRA